MAPLYVGLRSVTLSTYNTTVSPLRRPQSEQSHTLGEGFKVYFQQSIKGMSLMLTGDCDKNYSERQ
jgi:hypothetical protein